MKNDKPYPTNPSLTCYQKKKQDRFCSEQNSYVVPQGQWRKSCKNSFINGTTMYAQCVDNYGKISNASIDLATCAPNTIRNVQGRLICIPG